MTRILDLIPTGFKCPLCLTPRPNPHQWAITQGCEHAVVCRACVKAFPSLRRSPFKLSEAELEQTRLPCFAEKYYNVVAGELKPLEAGSCVVEGCDRRSRRPEGYCIRCCYTLLRDAHGGYGACREDERGRYFMVYNDGYFVEGEPAREAYYAWGKELLPRQPSRPAKESDFDAQAAEMWEIVVPRLDFINKVGKRRAGDRYSEQAHDAGVESAGKAAVTYDPTREIASIETYIYTAVMRGVGRAVHAETRRRRRERPLEVVVASAECKAARREQDRLFGRVRNPVQLIEQLELTEFQRKLLILHYDEGQTLEEIGRRYGVVKTTVHGWIHRIKEKCRAAHSLIVED